MPSEQNRYVDRDTGTIHPDGRSLVDAYIGRFSQRVSAASGQDVRFNPLDEDGYSNVARGSATVGINLLEEQDMLFFLTEIMDLPEKNENALFRRLLELNYSATSQGAFAIKPSSGKVCLRAVRPLDGLDYQEFEELLHSVATVADEWYDRLKREFGED